MIWDSVRRTWGRVKVRLADLASGPEVVSGPDGRFTEEADVTPIGLTTDRDLARVGGVIWSIAIGPRGPGAVFEADLADATGSIRVLWLGQRQILGMEPGRSAICQGRVCVVGGERIMRDPRYEIMPVGRAE
ncbi:MAG: hypothetical protein LBJ62_05925 [Bifidobacteriaceae bacterium]|nr:hypothetical protein [Bifidobacteriaceae bacterium]